MKIIFVRHGDPDYINDSLTDKGRREAQCLAERVATWDNITDFYISPKGRAQLTAKYSLDKIGRTGETLEWLREFSVDVKNPDGSFRNIPWDYMPEYWKKQEIVFDKDKWADFELFAESSLKDDLNEVKEGLDSLLSRYGIKNDKGIFRIDHQNDDTTIVIFCHLGLTYLCLSLLLGYSPFVMWHTFFMPPTGVTVLGAEEREPGVLNFRVEQFGDTRHLRDNREPVSPSGYFTTLFEK